MKPSEAMLKGWEAVGKLLCKIGIHKSKTIFVDDNKGNYGGSCRYCYRCRKAWSDSEY